MESPPNDTNINTSFNHGYKSPLAGNTRSIWISKEKPITYDICSDGFVIQRDDSKSLPSQSRKISHQDEKDQKSQVPDTKTCWIRFNE